jgi:hypothetical protein
MKTFLNAMTGISANAFENLAQKFDFSKYSTVADIGGALGTLSC